MYRKRHVPKSGQNCNGLRQLDLYLRGKTPITDGQELSRICREPVKQLLEKEEGKGKNEGERERR
jgi:hypothetical protein